VEDEGKLQGCLLEDREDQEDLALSTRSTKELTGRLSRLMMSESTPVSPIIEFNLDSRTEPALEANPGSFHSNPGSFSMGLQNTASIHQKISSGLLQNPSMKLGPLPIGLNNIARSYQDPLQEVAGPVRRLRLTGAQEGLILTMTSQDCLVHWPGPIPRSSNAQLVDETAVLPYQKGSMLYDTDASTEDINNSCKADIEAVHAREVFMVRQSPLIPPQAPDVRSSDESESNISPNALEYDGESEGQKQARERRNKPKEGRRRRARQHKEA